MRAVPTGQRDLGSHPRPSWAGSASTWDWAKSLVTRACAAAAAPFNSSNNRS